MFTKIILKPIMKNLKLTPYLLFAFLMFNVSSCDNEPLEGDFNNTTNNGNGTNTELSSLFDKWWYDSEDFTADIYFHSNGMYEQKVMLLGNEVISTGDWIWVNESERVMKIENLGGSGQVATDIWFRFSDVQESSFNIEQSQNGTSYSVPRLYLDTE